MAFMTIVEPSLMVRTNIRETNPKDQEKDSWEVLAMKIRGRGQLKCDALGICSLLNHKIISIPSTACWTQFSHRPIKKKNKHRPTSNDESMNPMGSAPGFEGYPKFGDERETFTCPSIN